MRGREGVADHDTANPRVLGGTQPPRRVLQDDRLIGLSAEPGKSGQVRVGLRFRARIVFDGQNELEVPQQVAIGMNQIKVDAAGVPDF